MRKVIIYLSLIVCLVLSSGCETLSIFGKSSKGISKQEVTIQKVEDKISNINAQKLEDISVLATGTDYSLRKVTNAPREVIAAIDINQRVITEAGYQPTSEQLKQMYKLIDDLILQNTDGKSALAKKDSEIDNIRSAHKALIATREKEISDYMTMAEKAAMAADSVKNELNKYEAYWGLGAVGIGLKSFATHVFWYGISFMGIFIILRFLSNVNPVAAAIFAIFEAFVGAFLKLISTIIPRAFNAVTTIEQAALLKIIDAIQLSKEIGKPTVDTIQTQLSELMTDKEKEKVVEIKKTLNYIKK